MQDRAFSRQDATAIIIGFGLVVVVVVFFAVKGMSPEKDDATTAAVIEEQTLPSVSSAEAVRLSLASGSRPLVLDIRTDVEYQASHIPDSVSVPADTIDGYAAVGGTDALVIPAREPELTADVVRILTGKGVRVSVIEGGISGWETAGGPVVAFGNPASPTDRSKVNFVSADAFKSIVEDRRILHMILDIRSAEAFAKSHVPESYNIPFSELEKRRGEIPPATNVALYGENDLEVFQASTRLFDFGVFSVKTLDVSFSEWETKGFPVTDK